MTIKALSTDEWKQIVKEFDALKKRNDYLQKIVDGEFPEGCTPADARMLREANHELADENYKLLTIVKRLVHYPGCWDAVAYPTLQDALNNIDSEYSGCMACAENALDTGWMQPRITPDIEIEANGRPYALLSESEKWRCDCLIAESISFFSDLKFLCLDRFDVLDIPARGQLIGFISFMHGDGELDCALVFGTLKSRPASNETVTALWVDGGKIAEPKSEKEKAA